MESDSFNASDGTRLHVYRWLPQRDVRATLQIAHGMGEHAARYDATAQAFNAAGYAVYANDHRGHGHSADPERLGWMGEDGWNRVISDAADLTDEIRQAHPGVPHVLLGHSMGAMLSQQYLYRFGARLNAAVLSGSPGFAGVVQTWISRAFATVERWRLGPDADSALLQRLLFGKSNDAFDGPDASGFEWLSRDAQQVQRYVDDPLCGFVLRAGSLCDLFAGARQARMTENVLQIPRQLPVLIFSGRDDPVHNDMKNLNRMITRYRDHLERVDERIYPGGRHEMLNETNREQVLQDVLGWLDSVLPAAPGASVAAESPN